MIGETETPTILSSKSSAVADDLEKKIIMFIVIL